ncbi:MAG: holo-ACP synthase [Candidatus Omnitrophica bacterium]|nr:holo-ACP synthase [Candidatus Omnitrophota bacterium]
MIINSGIDLIEVKRIKKAANRWGNKFIKRVFTDEEISYSKEKKFFYQHLAARFAAKEAVLKAFGEGWRGFVRWKDVEVLKNKDGKPHIEVYGYLRELKNEKMIKSISISLSHTKDYAVANCILVR